MKRESPSLSNQFAARDQFLAACSLAGAATTAYRNPNTAEAGEYWIDIARLGSPDAPGALVLACSLNGEEGFCGSTIMAEWLAYGQQRNIPRDVCLTLMHTVLPARFPAGGAPAPEEARPRRWNDTVLSAAAKRFASYTKQARKTPEDDSPPAAAKPSQTGWMEAASDVIADEVTEHAEHVAVLDLFGLGFGNHISGMALTASHVEFGVYTVGGILGLEARRSPRERRDDLRSLFAPQTEAWRDHVCKEGISIVGRALARLGNT